MAVGNYSIDYTALITSVTDGVSAGSVLVLNAAGSSYVVSTTDNRGTRRSGGIALTSGLVSVVMLSQGFVPASITGLGPLAGTPQYALVSSTGVLVRSLTATLVTLDGEGNPITTPGEVVGLIDEFGNATLDFSGSFVVGPTGAAGATGATGAAGATGATGPSGVIPAMTYVLDNVPATSSWSGTYVSTGGVLQIFATAAARDSASGPSGDGVNVNLHLSIDGSVVASSHTFDQFPTNNSCNLQPIMFMTRLSAGSHTFALTVDGDFTVTTTATEHATLQVIEFPP